MGDKRGTYRVLAVKPEGRKPHRRPRGSWEDYIRIGLQEVVREGID
jgi:hypothetical protein